MRIEQLLEVLKQVRTYDKGEKYKIDCYGNQFLLEKGDIDNLLEYINGLQQENQQLKEQLQYLRSGEYLNQLRFERDMLQNVVDNNQVSKEDKEFIDMTHRNTELLEQLQQRDEVIGEAIEYMEDYSLMDNHGNEYPKYDLLEILTKYKGDSNEKDF